MSAPPPVVLLEVLKQDALGRVELLGRGPQRRVRRVACGGRLPLSGSVARILLARERKALRALAGLRGVPTEEAGAAWSEAGGAQRRPPERRRVLVRTFLEGSPLHRAEELPLDFFELLAGLVRELHRRGVCHNDLHKEQNVLVAPDGRPGLIDFQLASVHRRRGALFASRAREDLRHVDKHRRRYTRGERGPQGARGEPEAPPAERGLVAAFWRRTAKPLYNLLTRRVLRRRDGEERRPSRGPWPRWRAPVGPRPPAGD